MPFSQIQTCHLSSKALMYPKLYYVLNLNLIPYDSLILTWSYYLKPNPYIHCHSLYLTLPFVTHASNVSQNPKIHPKLEPNSLWPLILILSCYLNLNPYIHSYSFIFNPAISSTTFTYPKIYKYILSLSLLPYDPLILIWSYYLNLILTYNAIQSYSNLSFIIQGSYIYPKIHKYIISLSLIPYNTLILFYLIWTLILI